MSLEHKDDEGAKIGMWLFLFTEIILFGGLFLLYSAYRSIYPHDFHHAGSQLNAVVGVINTVVLLTSSLTMVLAVTALQRGLKRRSMAFLSCTSVLGVVFLVNKFFEWSAKIHHGIYPNGPELLKHPPGEVIFYGLYYSMMGLHALHVLIGVVLLTVMLVLVARDRVTAEDGIMLENSGLYWHLIDVIWIFLLPLFYLAV